MHSRHKRNKVYSMLHRYDDKLISHYLEHGPEGLRTTLGITSDRLWDVIFDYLVFEKEVVKYCTRNNSAYIHSLFAEHGPRAIRSAFQLNGDKYEDIWEYVMDYIGISRGALYEYVSEKSSLYREHIYRGECLSLRKDLAIEKDKYEHVWGEVLDLLLNAVSTDAFTHSAFEHGLHLFSTLYNRGRKQRSLRTWQHKKQTS
ncbi:hypothetical protein GF369_01180 [Candidatus Peregrinibacteria bacterium]|nr:hypothetical protein [Candidatus Peregrinibacteria bacterium]